jgi:ataxin-3
LCAQHCLNALLQGQYYTAVELADIARQLDEAESAERHGDRPREEASANMDDTGFFSVQVIAKAISVWGLELVNYNSSDETAVRARDDPV